MQSAARKKFFAQVMEEHKKLIYKVSSMYCSRAEDRQDLMQEMAIQIWNALPKFDERFKLSTWLYRVVLNTAISHYRKSRRRNKVISPLDESLIGVAEESADKNLEDNLNQLEHFIQELSEFNKALMILYLDGNSYREIAEILGISESNVATKISRIKRKLKEKFSTTKPHTS